MVTSQGEGSDWHLVHREVSDVADLNILQGMGPFSARMNWPEMTAALQLKNPNFIGFILHRKSHPLTRVASVFLVETLKGNHFKKSGKGGRTEKMGGISFIQILLEVYKCITDISKTYPFYRARISSKVFTTVSGRAHTKGPLQTFFRKSLTLDTQHRVWPASPSQTL